MKKQVWIQDVLEAIEGKLYKVAERSPGIIPYTTVDGIFDDTSKSSICWWTNGFFGGMMWQMYHYTGKELYRERAISVEEKLDENLIIPDGMDHDSGFKWLPTAVAHYKIDGSWQSFRRGILAAENLAGRFNLAGNFIRAWNDSNDGSRAGTAIIDCMMNLPLLYWASEVTKDPRFSQIAIRHADMAMKYFIRENGSAIHIGEFDPATGEFLRSVGGQGYADGSSWTRGQAWALYGFVLSALHTGEKKYLETAKRVADNFILQASKRPDMGVSIDFDQPLDCKREDSSAAAIAACGLLELGKFDEKYSEAALKLLEFLVENRLSLDENTDYLLSNCADSFWSNREQMTLIYADYFLVEALLRLMDKDLPIFKSKKEMTIE
ncbi:MAG: glycoside hydrolase family 88 protein [Oscillospiraceae bacterium]|nr:glycoside hydrolase family 88 protein [Oscillospiraceae bacterium]